MSDASPTSTNAAARSVDASELATRSPDASRGFWSRRDLMPSPQKQILSISFVFFVRVPGTIFCFVFVCREPLFFFCLELFWCVLLCWRVFVFLFLMGGLFGRSGVSVGKAGSQNVVAFPAHLLMEASSQNVCGRRPGATPSRARADPRRLIGAPRAGQERIPTPARAPPFPLPFKFFFFFSWRVPCAPHTETGARRESSGTLWPQQQSSTGALHFH